MNATRAEPLLGEVAEFGIPKQPKEMTGNGGITREALVRLVHDLGIRIARRP